MTELSGTLDGLGLQAIVRFLGGLGKTGKLRLEQDGWQGELAFNAGTLTHARLGSRTGLAALDALVEALPRASFVFDSEENPHAESSIQLDRDALRAHMDALAARLARGDSTLPASDAVPTAVSSEATTDDPVQIDRATLQTLLIVDGRRNVREIVERRGSLDALWHLARLLEAGLIQLGAPAVRTAPATADPVTQEPSAPHVESHPTAPAAVAPPDSQPTVTLPVAPLEPGPYSDATIAAPELPVPAAHCPKLGFEDEPTSSFGRATRLHRCFANGRPLPLSLDQQRELCLSEQYGTCPRLRAAASAVGDRPRRSSAQRPEAPPAEEPRIVRLAFGGRPSSAAPTPSPAERDVATTATPSPRLLRPRGSNASAAEPAPTLSAAPTPLRARLNRGANAVAEPATQAAPAAAPRRPDALRPPADEMRAGHAGREFEAVPLIHRRIGPVPLLVLPAVALAVLALAALVYLLPRSDELFNDGGLDPNTLPNASLVEAGTPVASLGLNRPTPAPAQATPAVAGGEDATAEPTASAAQAANAASAAPTSGTTSEATAATPAPLFDERFASNDAGWPSNPVGAALITNGTYRIVTRQAGQFAAVSAPVASVPSDVVISATFRKLAGPPGGGYGIILRDQETAVRDGTNQGGQYYVLEAGDKGEVGIWRRDGDHWVDLLPWQHSDAVNTDEGTNDVMVRAVGNTLSLIVNGTPVATRTDATLTGGRAGLFVGGDGNQVAVSHFTIQMP